MSVLQIDKLIHHWPDGTPILDIEHLTLAPGEKLLLTGASGSGKSTLLNIIAGLLTPTSGDVVVLGQALARLTPAQKDALRANELGIIYQQLNLLPYLSAVDNVRMALAVAGQQVAQPVGQWLASLGIDDAQQQQVVRKLSMGQQQRVAIARALIGQPSLLLADEPTASLDRSNRDAFMSMLMAQLAGSQRALLMVSHDPEIADMGFDRVLDLAEVNRVLA